MEKTVVEQEYRYQEPGIWASIARLFSAKRHRIAFTAAGILVPSPDNSDEETLVRFDDIQSIGIEFEKDLITSKLEGLTCLLFATPANMHLVLQRKLHDCSLAEIIVRVIDNTGEQLIANIDSDLWFDLATQSEMAGEWYLAFRFFSFAANLLDGSQDGDYAINCVKRIKEKLDLAGGVAAVRIKSWGVRYPRLSILRPYATLVGIRDFQFVPCTPQSPSSPHAGPS